MKSYLRSAVLLIICLSTAIPVLAQCPKGKSEVIVMTPSGITKTICVSDNAIPGIENAAEHSGGLILPAECPCLDVWDGEPYPAGTIQQGSVPPPSLPAIIPSDALCSFSSGHAHAELIVSLPEGSARPSNIDYYATASSGTRQEECAVIVTDPLDAAVLTGLPFTIFTDGIVSPTTGLYTSSMMDACKALIEARGCVFE